MAHLTRFPPRKQDVVDPLGFPHDLGSTTLRKEKVAGFVDEYQQAQYGKENNDVHCVLSSARRVPAE